MPALPCPRVITSTGCANTVPTIRTAGIAVQRQPRRAHCSSPLSEALGSVDACFKSPSILTNSGVFCKMKTRKNIMVLSNADCEGPAKRARDIMSLRALKDCSYRRIRNPRGVVTRRGALGSSGGLPWVWCFSILLWGVRKFDHPWGLCDCLPIPSSL